MNYWIITVKNPYCDYILRGIKTMEIRKSVPATLQVGDVIFIARKFFHGSVVGACRVTSILSESVSYFCNYRLQEHKVSPAFLLEYAANRRRLVGIGLERMTLDTWALNVRSFGFERSPQWFYKIKPEYKSTIERVLI